MLVADPNRTTIYHPKRSSHRLPGRTPITPSDPAAAQPRVRTQLGPPSESGGKGDAGEEVSGELVVSRGDAAEVLEAAEDALDEIALPIKDGVVGDQRLASGD